MDEWEQEDKARPALPPEVESDLVAAAFEDSSIGMALIEVEGKGHGERVVKVNPALSLITGRKEDELLRSGREILGLQSRSRGSEAVRGTGLETSRVEFEHSFERPDRSRIWLMVTLSPITISKDAERGFRLAQIQDISDRREYQSRLRFLAEHDPLTGLANVRSLYDSIEKWISYQDRYGGQASLVSFDLDRFKLVNDAWGHAAGDEALKWLAGVLKQEFRDSDTLARLGGDEFAAFLPGSDLDGAMSRAESVLEYLRTHPIELVGDEIGEVSLTISAGVTELGERETVSARDLLAEADAALYAAKRAGRNCVVRFGDEKRPAAVMSERLTWAQRTRRALDEDTLFLEAQPIRDAETGDLLRYEALLRMNDPDAGVVYPPTFLYTAERFGLSAEIDRWVLDSAVRALSASPSADASLSVNLTAASLDPFISDLVETLPDLLKTAGVDPARLGFELTEGTCLADIERARAFTEAVQGLGCRVALDDFGAGFGGFYYLKMLPVNTLKIDGQFIRSLNASREDFLIVKAISDMAAGLGIEVVAEFVSSEEIARACREIGITAIQGSFAGPTVPLEVALGTT